jgi:hypothetical protein
LAPLWADTSVEKVVPGIIQAYLCCTHEFFEASCLDEIVPGVLRVPIEMIVMRGDLRDVIRNGFGSRSAFDIGLDKTLLFGDAVGKESTEQRPLFEKTLRLLFKSFVKKALPAFAGTSVERNSGKPLPHASFLASQILWIHNSKWRYDRMYSSQE